MASEQAFIISATSSKRYSRDCASTTDDAAELPEPFAGEMELLGKRIELKAEPTGLFGEEKTQL